MRAIIKKDNVREPEPGSVRPALPRARSAQHTKRVELLELDGHVHAIELTCSCGEVSVVELEYPQDPAQGAAQ